MPHCTDFDTRSLTLFFTVCLADRSQSLLVDHIEKLRDAVQEVRYEHPFGIHAWVVMPDHMHSVWQMPPGDRAFGQRWGAIKSKFTRSLRKAHVISREEMRHAKQVLGHSGVWQPRFRSRVIQSQTHLQRAVMHCWHNPVRHGLVQQPHDWPFSSIHRDAPRPAMAAE